VNIKFNVFLFNVYKRKCGNIWEQFVFASLGLLKSSVLERICRLLGM